MADPRPPTRKELSRFLPDMRLVRAFEKLFELVPDGLDVDIESANYAAAAADNKASEALGLLGRIAESLEDMAKTPPAEQHGFAVVDYVDFHEDAPQESKERRLVWNPDDGTLDVGLLNGSVLQIGQESHYYAKNTSGAQIDNGTPVMFTGTIGASGKLTFGKAVADGSYAPHLMMGVTTQDVANNDFGYVASFGLVRGLKTDGSDYGETWSDGDLLYFDPISPGDWTNAQPSAPAINTPAAVVVHAASGNSGSIFVRMDITESVSSLQDVEISTLSNNDFLVYVSANSRWENASAANARAALGLGSMALESTGASGSFTTTDGKTVTVANGVITSIV
jgi:hypothetical protein